MKSSQFTEFYFPDCRVYLISLHRLTLFVQHCLLIILLSYSYLLSHIFGFCSPYTFESATTFVITIIFERQVIIIVEEALKQSQLVPAYLHESESLISNNGPIWSSNIFFNLVSFLQESLFIHKGALLAHPMGSSQYLLEYEPLSLEFVSPFFSLFFQRLASQNPRR